MADFSTGLARECVQGLDMMAGVDFAAVSQWGHYDVTLNSGQIVRLAITEIDGNRIFGHLVLFTDHRMITDAEMTLQGVPAGMVNATLRMMIRTAPKLAATPTN
jgi:hypothetical protein